MKVLKKAKQRNVVIDLAYYDLKEIKEIMSIHPTFFFTKDTEAVSRCRYTYEEFFEENNNAFLPDEDRELRLFLDDVDELKVIMRDGYYYCMAVCKNGDMINVTL